MLTSEIQNQIVTAEARALATTGPHGVNVVPVSVVQVSGTEIHLYDFFMDKTVANLQQEAAVAFTAWSGLQGIQIKATAAYVTTGPVYSAAQAEMLKRFPERIVRGVIVLTPQVVYDVSAGAAAGTKLTG